MAITRRRLDFLKIIKEIYEATGLPVHYIQAAEKIGVSKWSAYEMLKTLEKEGFLTSHYEVNQGERNPGRAMVMFLPTPMLDLAVSGNPFDLRIPNREWHQIKERLLTLFDEPKLNGVNSHWDQLLSELSSLERPLFFCAYIIAIVLWQMQTLSGNSLRFIKNMATEVLKGQIGLAMFIGAAVGSIGKTAAEVPAINKLSESLSSFQKNLALLSEAEQALLLDFLETTLVKAI